MLFMDLIKSEVIGYSQSGGKFSGVVSVKVNAVHPTVYRSINIPIFLSIYQCLYQSLSVSEVPRDVCQI